MIDPSIIDDDRAFAIQPIKPLSNLDASDFDPPRFEWGVLIALAVILLAVILI